MTEPIWIDASTFQKPLKQIAEVIAQKVKREAPVPDITKFDLHILVRKAMCTYDLLYYLNADERREQDCHWRNVYTIVVMPLVRNMIDCLFNITLILQDPIHNGRQFRASGLKKIKAAIEENENRYGGKKEWDEFIAKRRVGLDIGIRSSGLTPTQIEASPAWPTLGRYAKSPGPKGIYTKYQQFLTTFLYGHWSEYSALAHATFEGLSAIALYYVEDSVDHDMRPKLSESHAQIMSTLLGLAATILLSIVTELQAYFRFDDDGAQINQRIVAMWDILNRLFDAKELYDERYLQLMRDKGITA